MSRLDRLIRFRRPLSGRVPLFVLGVVIGLVIALLHPSLGGQS